MNDFRGRGQLGSRPLLIGEIRERDLIGRTTIGKDINQGLDHTEGNQPNNDDPDHEAVAGTMDPVLCVFCLLCHLNIQPQPVSGVPATAYHQTHFRYAVSLVETSFTGYLQRANTVNDFCDGQGVAKAAPNKKPKTNDLPGRALSDE